VITNQALPDRDLGLLLQISVILAAAGITRVCFEWVQSRAVQLSQQRGAARSQLAGMHRLLRLPAEFFRKRNVGDLQLRFGALEELRSEIQQLLEGGLLRLVLDQHLHLVHAAHQREADGPRSARRSADSWCQQP
jgi:ATP-binding cassette subfamily B protein